jgi:antitoxin ParD1/3/4
MLPSDPGWEEEVPMATMNVSLPQPIKAWVEQQVNAGRYGNASDYARDLIRKDRERQEAVALLQRAITAGVESGPPEPFDANAFKLRMRERHVVR